MNITCSNCGTQNSTDSLFCLNCGSALQGTSQRETIKYQLKDNYGQTYDLINRTYQIGSDSTCTICIDEPEVKDHHAILNFDGQNWTINKQSVDADLQINDQKLKDKNILKENDAIRIGSTIFRLIALREEAPTRILNPVIDNRVDDFSSFRSVSEIGPNGKSSQLPVGHQSYREAQKKCDTCGKTIYVAAEICPFCGVRQAPAYGVFQPGKRSRVTAGLLAIILGDLGAHKFYLGQTGMGLLYLVFFWTYIPGIIGIVEGITYLTMSDEAFAQKYR